MMLYRIHSYRDLTLLPLPKNLATWTRSKAHFFLLEEILVDKRPKAHTWVPRTSTDKERDVLTMLGIPFLPQALR